MPGNYPKRNILQLKHGESLKTRSVNFVGPNGGVCFILLFLVVFITLGLLDINNLKFIEVCVGYQNIKLTSS